MFVQRKANPLNEWEYRIVDSDKKLLVRYKGDCDTVVIPNGEDIYISVSTIVPTYVQNIDFNNVKIYREDGNDEDPFATRVEISRAGLIEREDGEYLQILNYNRFSSLGVNTYALSPLLNATTTPQTLITYSHFFEDNQKIKKAIYLPRIHSEYGVDASSIYASSSIEYIGNFTPYNATILSSACSYCHDLRAVGKLPKLVEDTSRAFMECILLTEGANMIGCTKLVNANHMYCRCSSLTNSGYYNDLVPIKYAIGMFRECGNLRKVAPLPNSIEEADFIYDGCKSLVDAKLPDNAWTASGAFASCGITIAPSLPKSLIFADRMFMECANLTTGADVPDTVITTKEMYKHCFKLREGVKLGNSIVDTSGMYMGCRLLRSTCDLPDSVEVATKMYRDCVNLRRTPALGVRLVNMRAMFTNCICLTHFPEIPENVVNMSYAFSGCINIGGDLIIKSEKVEECNQMLQGCQSVNITIHVPSGSKTENTVRKYLKDYRLTNIPVITHNF